MRMYCINCHESVTVEEEHDYETNYHHYTCPECGNDDLQGITICACGNEKGESEKFCHSCVTDVTQTLTEFRDDHGMTQDDLEEIIADHFGW